MEAGPFALGVHKLASLEVLKANTRNAALEQEAHQHQVSASLLFGKQQKVDKLPGLQFHRLG